MTGSRRILRTSSQSRNKKKPVKKTGDKGNPDEKQTAAANDKEKLEKELPKNKKSFEKEVTLMPDTVIKVNHGKRLKRLIVSAKTEDGKLFKLKYKRLDDNNIRILNKVDSATKIKVSVLAKTPLEEKGWYRTAQSVARVMMMLRSVSVSYRNQYSMSLPGFMPTIGKAFGQTKAGAMSPGLDFAFRTHRRQLHRKGARQRMAAPKRLRGNSRHHPTRPEDLQLRATLEPVKDLKIDLTASRTQNTGRSIQYMYRGNPTSINGTFNTTTLSIKSAFEGWRQRRQRLPFAHVREVLLVARRFPRACRGTLRRLRLSRRNPVCRQNVRREERRSEQVQQRRDGAGIPRRLHEHGKRAALHLPHALKAASQLDGALQRTFKLPWLRDKFKSVNINHAYKSVYSVGSYSSYSTFMEYMNGLGFINDATTGAPVPSSMYNVSTVSINESFSPLLGVDVTLQNNMTVKMEYRSTRVLSLSMTSVQLNESSSHDWVIGAGYTINNFSLFGGRNHRVVKSRERARAATRRSSNRAVRRRAATAPRATTPTSNCASTSVCASRRR